MEIFVTILVIGIIGVVLFKLIDDRNRRGGEDGVGEKFKNVKLPSFKDIAGANPKPNDSSYNTQTMIIPEMYIDEIAVDKNNAAKVTNTISINRIFNTEYPDESDNRIIVICSREENEGKDYSDDYYHYVHLKKCNVTDGVSKQHLQIAKDSKGYFAKDNNSTNGTYLFLNSNNSTKKVEQFDISDKDGTIVKLGQYWVRFRLPDIETPVFFELDNTYKDSKSVTKIHNRPNISRD